MITSILYKNKTKEDLIKLLDLRKSIIYKKYIIQELFIRLTTNHIYLPDLSIIITDEEKESILVGNNGFYSYIENRIYLNEKMLEVENGLFIYSVLIHELKHAEQNYFVINKNFYMDKKEYIENLDICMNKTEESINFCNIKDKLVCFNIKIDRNIYNKTLLFYELNLAEREAYDIQNTICKLDLEKYTDLFNEQYYTNFSRNEIGQLIDICFLKLYHNEPPSGTYEEQNLQATIMYDIAHIGRYMYLISNETCEINIQNYIDEAQNLLAFYNKQKILSIYGYTVYNTKPINDLMLESYKYIANIESLKNMSLEQQRVNPDIIVQILRRYGKSVLPYIKDKDAFIYEAKKYVTSEYYGPILLECFPELKTTENEKEYFAEIERD